MWLVNKSKTMLVLGFSGFLLGFVLGEIVTVRAFILINKVFGDGWSSEQIDIYYEQLFHCHLIIPIALGVLFWIFGVTVAIIIEEMKKEKK